MIKKDMVAHFFNMSFPKNRSKNLARFFSLLSISVFKKSGFKTWLVSLVFLIRAKRLSIYFPMYFFYFLLMSISLSVYCFLFAGACVMLHILLESQDLQVSRVNAFRIISLTTIFDSY